MSGLTMETLGRATRLHVADLTDVDLAYLASEGIKASLRSTGSVFDYTAVELTVIDHDAGQQLIVATRACDGVRAATLAGLASRAEARSADLSPVLPAVAELAHQDAYRTLLATLVAAEPVPAIPPATVLIAIAPPTGPPTATALVLPTTGALST